MTNEQMTNDKTGDRPLSLVIFNLSLGFRFVIGHFSFVIFSSDCGDRKKEHRPFAGLALSPDFAAVRLDDVPRDG
jgi:hypothetical protein